MVCYVFYGNLVVVLWMVTYLARKESSTVRLMNVPVGLHASNVMHLRA